MMLRTMPFTDAGDKVATREGIEALGFESVWDEFTDLQPAYRFDFGNLELQEHGATARRLRDGFR